jgi:hypothetical protein
MGGRRLAGRSTGALAGRGASGTAGGAPAPQWKFIHWNDALRKNTRYSVQSWKERSWLAQGLGEKK